MRLKKLSYFMLAAGMALGLMFVGCTSTPGSSPGSGGYSPAGRAGSATSKALPPEYERQKTIYAKAEETSTE